MPDRGGDLLPHTRLLLTWLVAPESYRLHNGAVGIPRCTGILRHGNGQGSRCGLRQRERVRARSGGRSRDGGRSGLRGRNGCSEGDVHGPERHGKEGGVFHDDEMR